jgi:hypothetical protein
MTFFSSVCRNAFVGLVCLTLSSTNALSQDSAQSRILRDDSLRRFLQTWSDNDSQLRYEAAFYDLNDDGVQEAIVYLTDGQWCGSGGCLTLVLKQQGETWAVVARISVVHLPIRVLQNVSHGWHSLAVEVRGGGVKSGYEAELPFDGKSYPSNPTIPPARRLEGKPLGETIIPGANGNGNGH